MRGHTGTVTCVGFAADGQVVASGGDEGAVRLWDAEGGQAAAIREVCVGKVRMVVVSADGRTIACGGQDGTVRLWDATTGRSVAVVETHAGGV